MFKFSELNLEGSKSLECYFSISRILWDIKVNFFSILLNFLDGFLNVGLISLAFDAILPSTSSLRSSIML